MTNEQNWILVFYVVLTAFMFGAFANSIALLLAVGFLLAFVLKLVNCLARKS